MIAREQETRQRELIPAGVHMARCVWVTDMGTQYNKAFDKWNRKIQVTWEVPSQLVTFQDKETGVEITKPRVIGSQYTLSLSPKGNLRKDLESWLGGLSAEDLKGFDPTSLVNKPCQLNVVHKEYNGNTYANVGSIMAVPAGVDVKEAQNETIVFDLDAIDNYDEALGASPMPDWMKDKVRQSKEYVEWKKSFSVADASFYS